MKKELLLFFTILASIVFFPANAFADENDETVQIVGADFFKEAFVNCPEPVMIKYIAAENKNAVVADEESGTAVITDKNGETLKTYKDIVFIDGEPIIDAGILERDMGWTVCRHIPERDTFIYEQDAVLAGGLTLLGTDFETPLEYYVGRRWDGFYFSAAPSASVDREFHSFFEKRIVVESIIEQEEQGLNEGGEKLELSGVNEGAEEISAAESTSEKSSFADIMAFESKPVLFKYVLRKNGYWFSYDENDDKIYIYDADGGLVSRLKNVPTLYGNYALDSSTLERAIGIPCAHEPDSDFFETEADAVTAGWLTYLEQSEGRPFTYYVGSCYPGYYFSAFPGSHTASCPKEHKPGYFYEFPVTIENGALEFIETQSNTVNKRDVRGEEFLDFELKSRKVLEDKPENALTKMVVLSNLVYNRPEGVQTSYFAYRDQIYRDFWDDAAGWDVADYVFIPPAFPIAENYDDFIYEEALAMSEAVKKLLEKSGDAQVWIGTPGITSLNYNHSAITSNTETDFVNRVKIRLGSDVWNNNVAGIYINQESIYPEEGRTQIERMKKTVGRFKNGNPSKQALWIPYYDLAAGSTSVSEKIAEVSRVPNLFDYIIIQPGYFFFDRTDGVLDPSTTSHREKNIEAIIRSVENRFISDNKGEPVEEKKSNALIGLEMEPQASYFSNSMETREEAIDRYTQYLLAGAKIKDTGPLAYYMSGDPHCYKESLLYKFYEADELNASAVRKKLDASLNEFFGYVFETRETDAFFAEYAKKIYLEADPAHTEEDFKKAFNPAVVTPEFYKYEKLMRIGDLAAHIEENRPLDDYFINNILERLGCSISTHD